MLIFIAIGMSLGLSACASGSSERGSFSSADGRFGRIVFHDPAQGRGKHTGSRGQPITVINEAVHPDKVSASEADNAPGVQAVVGTSRENQRRLREGETKTLRSLQMTGIRPTRMTGTQFAQLWDRLESVGLFNLPRHSGDTPPKHEAYFLLESGDDRRIYLGPRATLSESASRETKAQYTAWFKSKEIVVLGDLAPKKKLLQR